MADVLIDENVMAGLAGLLREKNNNSARYYPSQMEPAFRALLGGGDGSDTGGGTAAVLQPLSVTQNGTYVPPSGVDGFNRVEVNVPSEGDGDSGDSGAPSGLFNWIEERGYLPLFCDGEFFNSETIEVCLYEVEVSEEGYLLTNAANGAGIYTRGAGGYSIHIVGEFDDAATAYYTQFGRSSATATLPTIQTTGAGRTSYTTSTGSAGAPHLVTIHGTNEKFLGTNTNCRLRIYAIYAARTG